MSPKQTAWYWREWAAVRRIQPNADRHEIHRKALGKDRSSKSFSNFEFDLVLIEFVSISDPSNLNKLMSLRRNFIKRAEWTIKQFPPAYVETLCASRFGTRLYQKLKDLELCQLAMTLNNRRKSLDDREIRHEDAVEQSLESEEGCLPDDTTEPSAELQPVCDGEPF